jgi:hypothetical protein
VIIHRIDLGIVGPVQLAAQLQVVGRVGEDQVDRARGQAFITSMQSPQGSGSAARRRCARCLLVAISASAPGIFVPLYGE